jgi:hypothetical protein
MRPVHDPALSSEGGRFLRSQSGNGTGFIPGAGATTLIAFYHERCA